MAKQEDARRYAEMKREMVSGTFSGETPTTLDRGPETKSRDLSGLRVAVIVSDGFEQAEFDGPVCALKDAGAIVEVLAEDAQHLEHIRGVNHLDPAPGTRGHKQIGQVSQQDYDMLLVPGGAVSPDTMRQSEAHLHLVKSFFDAHKPVAMICHGPWLLADAELARGRRLTSWPGIRRDLERAGATWVDEEVVVDDTLITSRKPADVEAFNQAIMAMLSSRKAAR